MASRVKYPMPRPGNSLAVWSRWNGWNGWPTYAGSKPARLRSAVTRAPSSMIVRTGWRASRARNLPPHRCAMP